MARKEIKKKEKRKRYIYIYIYIEREREREKEKEVEEIYLRSLERILRLSSFPRT